MKARSINDIIDLDELDLDDIRSPKYRPLRVYSHKGGRFVYDETGKRQYVYKKMTHSEAQREFLKKFYGISNLSARINPHKKIAESQRVRFKIAPRDPEQETKELTHYRDVRDISEIDEGLKQRRRGISDMDRLLAIRAKIDAGHELTADEKALLPILIAKVSAADTSGTIAKLIEAKKPDKKKPLKPGYAGLTAEEIKRINDQKYAEEEDKNMEIRRETMKKIMTQYGLRFADFLPFEESWNKKLGGPAIDPDEHPDHYVMVILEPFMKILRDKDLPALKSIFLADTNNNPFDLDNRERTKADLVRKVLAVLTPKRYTKLIKALKNAVPSRLTQKLESIPDKIMRQYGSGMGMPALWNDEIDAFFEDADKYPHYGGTIAADQIKDLPKSLPIGFVMNLDNSNKEGSHWVAVYINGDSIEYFDPLAEPPSKEFKRDIKKYVESMKIPILFKLKVNKIKQQNDKSDNCGYHAIKFLDDRFAGIPYKWATRYKNNEKNGERELEREFDYI